MENNIIKQPKIFLIIGIAYLLIFSIISLYFLLIEFDIEGFIAIILICIPGVIFLLFGLLWKIEICNTEYIYTNFIGIKKRYKYHYLDIKWNKNGYKIYKDKKVITRVSIYAQNFESLQNKILEVKKMESKKKH